MARPQTVAIIGLGLMGGSLAAAVRRKIPKVRVLGISRNRAALRDALRKGWVHEAARTLEAGIPRADFVVLCTPVDTLRASLAKIDRWAKKGTVVTDVGSVKGDVLRWTPKTGFRNIRFIGAHPMAGSHARGFGAAQERLYEGAQTFVIRSEAQSPAAYRKVCSFWQSLGTRVIGVTAREHDRIVAEISHLPHAMAACLVLSAAPKSLLRAASGFKDTTRIAMGHPDVWLPIFQSNRHEILRALKIFEGRIRAFKTALALGKQGVLARLLGGAARKRSQISF